MVKAQREARMARFAAYLKRLRKSERKMTQQELAEKTGLSHGYIGFLEQQRELPSRGVLQRLAKALGADYDEMLREAGYMQSNGGEGFVDAAGGAAATNTQSLTDLQDFDKRRIFLSGQWDELNERGRQSLTDLVKRDDLEQVVELAWHFVLHAPDWPAAQAVRDEEVSLGLKVGVIDLYQRASGRILLKEFEVAAVAAHLKPVARAGNEAEHCIVLDAEENTAIETALDSLDRPEAPSQPEASS